MPGNDPPPRGKKLVKTAWVEAVPASGLNPDRSNLKKTVPSTARCRSTLRPATSQTLPVPPPCYRSSPYIHLRCQTRTFVLNLAGDVCCCIYTTHARARSPRQRQRQSLSLRLSLSQRQRQKTLKPMAMPPTPCIHPPQAQLPKSPTVTHPSPRPLPRPPTPRRPPQAC